MTRMAHPSPASRSSGSCFGFEIDSPLAFEYLRSGSAPRLRVTEMAAGDEPRPDVPPLLEWRQRNDKPFLASLYESDGTFSLWIQDSGWFRVDPRAPAIEIPTTPSGPRRENRVWGIPAALCYMARGDQAVHAAAVDVDGSALLLAAPGRFGKTTLAGGFLRLGHRLLSEDMSCVRSGTPPEVIPGPAGLRLRRDVYESIRFPGTYPTAEEADRVHLALDPSLRGDSRPVPLRGIVFLRRGDEEFRLTPIQPHDALRDFWSLGLNLPTDRHRAAAFDGVVSIVNSVPVWNLTRRLKFASLDSVVSRLIETCLS